MGILKFILQNIADETPSPQPRRKKHRLPSEGYSPEGYVIYEQERSGERWHGVPVSELSKLARQTYRGKFVKIDEYQFLVFYYSSKSKKTGCSVQCTLDENRQLKRMTRSYYPGQWKDSADDFIEIANRQFTFR